MHRLNKTTKPTAAKRMLQYQMHMMNKINITREEKLIEEKTELTHMHLIHKAKQRTPRILPNSTRTMQAQDQQRTTRILPSNSLDLQRTTRTLPSSTRTRPMLRAKVKESSSWCPENHPVMLDSPPLYRRIVPGALSSMLTVTLVMY